MLKSVLLMIYPYTPFIAEEIYLNLPEHLESIMVDRYPEVDESRIDEKSEALIADLIAMIKDIRAYKVENQIAPNGAVSLTLIPTKGDVSALIPYLKRFAFAKEINVRSECEGNLHVYGCANLVIEDQVDKDALLARLNKEIERLNGEVERGTKMLSNPNFLAKAPKEKVEREESKLRDYRNELAVYLEKAEALKKR